MNNKFFCLIISLGCLIKTTTISVEEKSGSGESIPIKRDGFIKAAFKHEKNLYKKNDKLQQAESLNIEDPIAMYGCCRTKRKTVVTFSDDPLFEIFRLGKFYKRVCANTDADSENIGGNFTIADSHGIGQEESIMSAFSCGFLSLKSYAVEDSLWKEKDEQSKRFTYLYKDKILDKRILFSHGLYPRIPTLLFDKYWEAKGNFKSFSDYIESNYSENKFDFVENHDFRLGLFTISALDRRDKTVDYVDYNMLEINIRFKITKMLLESYDKFYDAIVITIPGSGVRSNKTREKDSKKDLVYLDTVEKATMAAIYNFGGRFKEIVVCGHRSNRNLIKN